MTRRRGAFACLVALWLALCAAGAAAAAPAAAPVAPAAAPLAQAGRLVIPSTPKRPVALNGEWVFRWHAFVEPHWDTLPAGGVAPVPSSWNDIDADGKAPGPEGWGSYLLRVDCPAGQSLAIEPVGQRTAARLFVNGVAVAAHGEPGPAAGESRAAVFQRVPITREFACPLRLTLHISNFDHRAGGFVRPMYAGPADVLERQRESRVARHAALLTAYLVTGIVCLIFFAVRRRERLPLLFGLFCLLMAVYTDMIGERLFLRPLAGQPSWFAYMRVEYLSWLGAEALFLLTLQGLFPAEIHRRAVRTVLALLAAAALAVLALPPAVYSYLVVPGQAIAVLVGAYVAAAMLRARERSPFDARVVLAGMLLVLGSLALDLLLIDVPGPDRKLAPFGFAVFLLSPALVMARRLTHALNAEERARALEENARLREDVERMSRHDLKTPLNSILGVGRLLRDDARLSTDQRELVDVLQRAGLRMLEMVNLSLGLFRMETGSYAFQPQAVELRELVTRVLVDLHPFAEAGGVTLAWQGSGQAPVYVRAEDLLCYSIVANLVRNAIEAAGVGGQVSVAMQAGDPVVLSIHNPGEVPADIVPRFFEKYVTGRSGGTGLGTYSARLMARAQQGDLQMRTGAAGTTVTLTLAPLKGAPPPPPRLAVPADAAKWASGMAARDVLLVDDDEYTRLVNRRLLPSPPFSVQTAANGQAAVDAMVRHWPHYLLIDLEMPLKDGIETVRWVRAQEAQGRPRCRVVMVSGNDDPGVAQRALAAGAARFLLKPVSREALLSALRELELAAPPAPPAPPAAPAPGFEPRPESRSGPESKPESPSGLPFESASASAPGDELVGVEPDWVEFFPDFVKLQRETVEAMGRALLAGDRQEVGFLAHRAAGGLATMGMGWAARQSRAIEREAAQAAPEVLRQRIDALREHLQRVRLHSG